LRPSVKELLEWSSGVFITNIPLLLVTENLLTYTTPLLSQVRHMLIPGFVFYIKSPPPT
jgi:hypothetical protein